MTSFFARLGHAAAGLSLVSAFLGLPVTQVRADTPPVAIPSPRAPLHKQVISGDRTSPSALADNIAKFTIAPGANVHLLANPADSKPFSPFPDSRPAGMAHGDLVSYDVAMRRLKILDAARGPAVAPIEKNAATQPQEIVELARALKNDPDLIFEYVHNNIETLPQYGSLKGARGALIEGKGTAFDQAELMVALLQQAGISARIQTGPIQLSTSYLAAWLGTDTNRNDYITALINGGFPTLTVVDNNSNPIGAQIGWAWVQATIDGGNYVFDPAGKFLGYSRQNGIDLGAAMGYNHAAFVADAENGATVGMRAITNLNRTRIRNNLAAYTGNLARAIRANTGVESLTNIIGGKTIVPLRGIQIRYPSLGYNVPAQTQTWASLPSQFRTTLTVRLGWNNTTTGAFTALTSPLTFNSSDINGHRLTVSLNGSLVPSLLLDGAVQASATAAPPANTALTIRTSVVHPYADNFENYSNSDQLLVAPYPNGLFLIGTGWGNVGRGLIETHRKLLQQNAAQNPGNDTAESVLGESFAVLSENWLVELSREQEIVDAIQGTNTVFHHAIGITALRAVTGGQTGPYVDLPLNDLSVTQRSGRADFTSFTPTEINAFYADAQFLSIAESGVLEQTQPGLPAVSTVKLIDNAIASGTTIYNINDSRVSGDTQAYYNTTQRPALVPNYNSGDLARIDYLVSRGDRVVAPANGRINVNAWSGAGYFDIGQTGTNFIGSIITGGLSGGFAGLPWDVPTFDRDFLNFTFPPSSSPFLSTLGGYGNGGAQQGRVPSSRDPINLVTGDYLNTKTDLAIGGDFPYGLSFTRSYDSGTRGRNGPLGYGWTHNFAITAQSDSDAFVGLGQDSAVSAAAAIVATYVARDILTPNAAGYVGFEPIVTGSIVNRWFMDQLTNNVVDIAQAGSIDRFVKLPDGTYNPPLGSAANLTLANGTYTYTGKDGTVLTFQPTTDAHPANLASWRNPAGVTVTFGYDTANPPRLTSVSNNLGRRLSLSYDGSNRISGVSDGTGRSTSYSYDGAGNLTSARDPLGNATTYAYDQPGRMTQIFNPSNPTIPVVTNTYDSLGRVATQANANNGPGFNTTWSYYFAGSRSEEVNPLGVRHVLYSNPRGKTLADIQDYGGLTLETDSSYDDDDRLTQVVLPEGNEVTYTYDARGNVLSTTQQTKPLASDLDGNLLEPITSRSYYDPTYNQPSATIDGNGNVTCYTYDTATSLAGSSHASVAACPLPAIAGPGTNTGVLLERTIPNQPGEAGVSVKRMAFTYQPLGLPVSVTDEEGRVTRYAYDGNGNRVSVIQDANNLALCTLYGYTARGDVASERKPRSTQVTNGQCAPVFGTPYVTRSAYDDDRRLVSTSTGLSATPTAATSMVYDGDGQVVRLGQMVSSGPAGEPALGRLNPVNPGAQWRWSERRYSPSGQQVSETDPAGRVTQWRYDLLDRVSEVQSPTGRIERRAYDAAGRVTSVTQDSAASLDPSLTRLPAAVRRTNGYNANGTLAWTQDGAGRRIAFTYDGFDRLQRTTQPDGTYSGAIYDADGNATILRTRSGLRIAQAFDRNDRMTSQALPAPV
ncbi:MAG TPA: DUF6531 domain-containing protein, partial [Dongiaceae bacterium]|nr:DUF6531 domain-containing protein [Dongiaceae bacterium]